MARIALITPTGARPKQMEFCAQFMKQQTYDGEVIWVIVDDAEPTTTDHVKHDFRAGWQICKIYPKPSWSIGENTQGRNIMTGINYLQGFVDFKEIPAIFIIEDDDYYKPIYLAEMMRRWNPDAYDIMGESQTIYYNVAVRGWLRNKNDPWSSLFQTCFHPRIIPVVEHFQHKQFIDMSLFSAIDPSRRRLFRADDLAIGIKGQAGRKGIGGGHSKMIGCYEHDPEGLILKKFIGDDAKYYLHGSDNSDIPNA